MPAPFDVRHLAHRLLQLSDERNTRMIVNVRSSADGQRYSVAVMERAGGDPPYAIVRLVEDEGGRGTLAVEERFTGLPPAVPSVHLNGTSADELLLQVGLAAAAVHAAEHALADAAPHGRDYYSQGERAYAEARVRHESRLARLRSVLEELKAVHEGVSESADARARPA